MSGKNKKAAVKVKQDPEADAEPASLRRSTRATRGSVKPVVDLTQMKIEADESDEDQEVEEVEVKPSSRRSSVKRELAKKEPVKRAANKRPVSKKKSSKAEESVEDDKAVKEEREEEEDAGKTGVKEEPNEESEGDDLEAGYELNEKEMKEINHAFDMNRLGDNDEYLNTDGLRTAIRSLGFEPRGDEIKRLMKKFTTKGASKINRHGFHQLMAFKFSTTPAMSKGAHGGGSDEISRVFNLLDLDKTGLITLANLKSIAAELNEDLNDDELLEMIQEADQDYDNMINKHEFENIMKKTSLY